VKEHRALRPRLGAEPGTYTCRVTYVLNDEAGIQNVLDGGAGNKLTLLNDVVGVI